MLQGKGFSAFYTFGDILMKYRPHEWPKAILRMPVKETHVPALFRRKRPKDQNLAMLIIAGSEPMGLFLFHRIILLFLDLSAGIELIVFALLLHEVFMVATFDDGTLFENHDRIAVLDGG